MLMTQLHLLRTDIRNVVSAVSGKRQPRIELPGFEKLFRLSTAPEEETLAGFVEFEMQMQGNAGT